MNPLVLDLLPFIQQGCCCSQLLVHLTLRLTNRECPDLVRAAHGLCYGIGQSNGPCGLLTGGACCLGFLAGKGSDSESALPMFTPLLNEYALWFTERVQPYGGTGCDQIAMGLCGSREPNPMACGDLLAECWEKILELLQTYEVPLA